MPFNLSRHCFFLHPIPLSCNYGHVLVSLVSLRPDYDAITGRGGAGLAGRVCSSSWLVSGPIPSSFRSALQPQTNLKLGPITVTETQHSTEQDRKGLKRDSPCIDSQNAFRIARSCPPLQPAPVHAHRCAVQRQRQWQRQRQRSRSNQDCNRTATGLQTQSPP